ncbi:MAG: hypothetical protein AMXMBFR64_32490 [Myxococcales bacterium]
MRDRRERGEEAERAGGSAGALGPAETRPRRGNAAMARAALAERGAPRAVRQVLEGGGRPLHEGELAPFEGALDGDLSGVRIHEGANAERAAASVGARAFTAGQDVVMGSGATAATLAEEVVHALQPQDPSPAALVSDPGAAAEHEARGAVAALAQGRAVTPSETRTAALVREASGASRISELRQLLDDGDEDGAISLMGRLSAAEVASVLGNASLKQLAVSCFDDEEMYRGVRAMGGDLWKSLDWMFAEGTSLSYVLDVINRCASDAQKDVVRRSGTMRSHFVGLCDDGEMVQVTSALGGTLAQKLDWMFAEGTSWQAARALIVAAPEDQKAAVRTSATMRASFISLLGNDEMRDCVQVLGGRLIDQLTWMFAEGTDWPSVRQIIEAQPDPAQRAAVRQSAAMRDALVGVCGDDEMEDAVVLLGGDLRWRLQWMFAEGTSFEAVKRQIGRCPESERAAVTTDTALRDHFVSLLGDQEMQELVGILSGDLLFKVDWLIAEGTSWDAIKTHIQAAPESQKAAVRGSATARARFCDLLGNDQMAEAVDLLGGDLRFKLDWMFEEGTDWAAVRAKITAADEAGKAAVRADPTMRGHFVSLLGNAEMQEAVGLLGGDLRFKLDWMMEEGTDWATVRAMIVAADEPQRAAVRGDSRMRGHFVSLLGNVEMADAVVVLGGDLRFQLDWMFAEGTDWPTVKARIQAADEAGRAAVRGDRTMRDRFVSLLGDDEMREAVDLLGGDLRFKLEWMMEEGTEWSIVRAMIVAASEAERATVRGDRRMRERFVSLLGNDEMADAVVVLGGDLRFQLDWMFAEGTDWATVRGRIQAADDAGRAAVRQDPAMRGHFVSLLGNDEMAEAVVLLGGDLRFQLDWMFAEGTDWPTVRGRIQAAGEAERAAVRAAPGMRALFVSLCGDAEMAEAVGLLGGDLRFKLEWTLEEGTTWAAARALIEAAPEAERAVVRGDAAMRDRFVGLLGDDEMAEAVDVLGGDLRFKLTWMFAEGTDWAAVRAKITAADEAGKAAVRGDAAMRGHFVSLLGNAEMAEAVGLLGGDLRFKLDWMFEEGTDWATVRPLLVAAPEAERAAVRTDRAMRGHFVSLLGDEEMKDAVTVLGGDLRFKLEWTLEEGTTWAEARALIEAAPETERAAVRADAAMRARFVSLLGDDEMRDAVGLLGGDLRFKLDWMFAEGTSWESVRPLIEAAPETERAAVRTDPAMRAHFVSLLGNDEMAAAVQLLGGDLLFQLDWMFAEGTDWPTVRERIRAAPEAQRAAVRESAAMKGRFIELLGNDEMREAVGLLGGDVFFHLTWMLAEGTSWEAVRAELEAADEAGKARIRGDLGMRGWFVDNLNDAQMADAVGLLGGDLRFKLGWTLAEGTTWAAVRALIEAAPAPERTAVASDHELMASIAALCTAQELRAALDLLGADLVVRVGFLLGQGIDDAGLRATIAAAPPEQQMALIGSTHLAGVLATLTGSAIDAFTALADPGRFATAMGNPTMVSELLEQPADGVLTRLAGTEAAAAAALNHMDDSLSWMRPLPVRGALSEPQRQALRVLFNQAPRVPQRWSLFERRFGADLSGRWGSTLDPGDLGRLWTILDRLPESQIEDNRYIDDLVRHFRGGGTYQGGTINIGSMPNDHDFYAPEGWRTRSEIAGILGISEADVDAQVTAGMIRKQTIGGQDLYSLFQSYTKPQMAGLLGITEADVDTLAASSVLVRNGTLYRINHAQWRTAAEMAAYLGIPEGDLDGRVTAGQLVRATVGGAVKYAVRLVVQSYFDHTVLHEVGHAVDDMLGNHTDIVYGWAGWEKYGEGDVRRWADQMGGWGPVQAGDTLEDIKSAICSAMDDYMDKSSDIPAPGENIGADLPPTHAWHRYSNWPIVRWAGTKMFHYTTPHPHDDGTHLYTANFYYQKWMRVKSAAVRSIPRDYTRFAPEEWFADSYAEFYRLYDGTPATEHLKGGNLQSVVKEWFRQHVDQRGRTPQNQTAGGRPSPTSGVHSGRR